jgi:hypothetical protein
MTPQQLQIVRRLHHEHAWKRPAESVQINAGQLTELINAVWAAEQRAARAEAVAPQDQLRQAEERLTDLLGPEGLTEFEPEQERRVGQVPPRQLTFAGAPPRP